MIDLDGTLYRQPPVRGVMALQIALRGRTAIPVIQEFRREHERLHHEQLPPGASPFEWQIERTAERLGLRGDDVREIVDQWMFARPLRWIRMFRRRDLLARIAEFRARGGRTAVVSDYPARRKLSAMGISSQFDAVIASGDPRGPSRLKPDPESCLMAAAALQVPPSECLVIGDRADVDGEAARRADMCFWHVASRWKC